jgi:hypothetical protein
MTTENFNRCLQQETNFQLSVPTGLLVAMAGLKERRNFIAERKVSYCSSQKQADG